LAFASTVGALRAAGFGGEIDSSAIAGFLSRGFVGDGESIYTGILKLPPATIVEWQDGRISQRQYWSLPEPRAGGISFDEAVEETERRLEAVRLRLVADVNVAALLSGGVDSAMICWALTKLNANVRAFTVAARGDASDETVGARQTLRSWESRMTRWTFPRATRRPLRNCRPLTANRSPASPRSGCSLCQKL
jgi:asparagine synthase (glutamine-hydrolysing)